MIQFEEYKQKLLALEPRLEELARGLGLSAMKEELSRLVAESEEEGYWNDLARSQEAQKTIRRLENVIGRHKTLCDTKDDLLTLCEMALEENDDGSLLPEVESGYAALEEKISNERLSTLLKGRYDNSAAIVSLHAGAGGTEAQDWVQMLVRMYTRYAERHGFSCKTLDFLDGDEAGLKSAELLVEGDNAYGFLKGEHGVHRLVRISPFDSSGRRHTSFAAAEVQPDMELDGEIEIRDEDLKVDTYRSGGAGGQHVNKTESAIRIQHIPTGIVVACQNERSQHQNRDVAMRMLRAKLLKLKEEAFENEMAGIKGVQRAIEWGSQIRSYVFMPYTLAKDHRTGYEDGNITAVMDGKLDGFVSAYLTSLATGQWAVK
ncbi:MAG: peptide chain release factor 2 [Oscillospiraceae bacterium]|jgi:peptide chain release factor 2|nr:peptide chain release factor 2 [Oscillospiraceae bacterium]